MLEKVKRSVEKYSMLQQGDKILVGVSGGPDSVALLHILIELRDVYSLTVWAVHLNHMFRGQEAEEDARYVEALCKEMGVPSFIEAFDVPAYIKETGLSPEDAARRVRYLVYDHVAERVGANKIALGHNADDQAETVLMRLLRGTGLRGLGGIPPVRDGKIIRPLIEITRGEIEAYCSENNLSTRIDATNLEPIYFRNKIRLELLPFIEENFSPTIKRHLSVLSDILREDEKCLDEEAQRLFRQLVYVTKDEVTIPIEDLLELSLAMQRRIIRKVFEESLSLERPLAFDRVQEILDMANAGPTGSSLHLAEGLQVHRSHDALYFRQGQWEGGQWEEVLKVPGLTRIQDLELRSQVLQRRELKEETLIHHPGAPYAYLDLSSINRPIVVRNRRDGDIFQPLGMDGKKKLKDFFIDEKIPRHRRFQIPLIATGNTILWVIGWRISEEVKVTADSEEVALVEVYNIVI